MFTEFAYDENDSDETVEIDGNLQYKHPFFFGKLRKFDGEHGFNLFDQAIETEEMKISFTDGSLVAVNLLLRFQKMSKRTVQVIAMATLLEMKMAMCFVARSIFKYPKPTRPPK